MAKPSPCRHAPQDRVEREALRILPQMARPGARARLVPAKRYGEPARVAVFVRGSKARCARIDVSVVKALAARELVSAAGAEQWQITPAGLAWVERNRAGEEGFRAQHQQLEYRTVVTPDRVHRKVRANAAESPLEWLHRRKDADGGKFLSQEEFEAGERLRRDFTYASISPSVTANWSGFHLPRENRRGRSANDQLSDNKLAARQRFEAALINVGPELGGLLVDVCCLLVGLEEAERTRLWPRRSAKIVLRVALSQLARHYGFEPASVSGTRRRSHHWGQLGYRPTISDMSQTGG